jgi:uncharacterized protein (TIGR02301 family)
MMLPLLRFKPLTILALCATLQMVSLTLGHAQAQKKSTGQQKTEALVPPASPESNNAKPAPYDGQLARLSEILGALHYIESLCKSATNNDWRADMSKLLAAEVINEPQRQERFTAAYNRGYRTFAAVYTDCTDNAKAAENTYRHEGATLAQEITSRFGN